SGIRHLQNQKPKDPDGTARQIRKALSETAGQQVAIVISDTHGRPFRLGNVGVAIGVAGMQALVDERGERDLFGRELVATVQGYGDMVAAAAHLLCGEGAEGRRELVHD
ncbi:MAG: coenzyme F420-0:L-glutamate ligase, partial [SAR324 cluster bacterium]|nr:coenzyme F420-0:L-glutamate ligase [SAR324 cluster bacterium]